MNPLTRSIPPSVHQPVMLREVLEALNIRPEGLYLDGTFGRGGHTSAILSKLGPAGRLLALDRDPEAIAARSDLAADARLERVHASFGEAGVLLAARGWQGRLDGALLDLGVSSPQLDDPARGFSFRADGPLDMRMDPSSGEPVSAWLNRASESEIRECLWTFGEERRARQIAQRICLKREEQAITTTRALAELVGGIVKGEHRIDPATRTFQALRIFINDELGQLKRGLTQLVEALAVAGRLVVLSFHSLEDRIVKRHFRELARPLDAEGKSAGPAHYRLVHRKSVVAGEEELASNPRARSARLRALERIA